MMKIKRIIQLFLLCLGVFLINIPLAWGNPIPVYSIHPGAVFHLYTILFYLTYVIEFNIIYHFLKNDNTKRSKLRKTIVSENLLKSKLRKAVVSVNLLTYPLTQMVAITFIQTSFIFYFIIELIPVILEFLLLLKIFKQFLSRGYFRSPIPAKVTGLSILEANFATFILGIGISLWIFPFQALYFI
ncbi:MAG: hypothetical protein ACFFB4_03995 [Promethearchaeota archaeon]